MRVATPVGVGSLDGDFAFDDVAVEKSAELLGQVLLNAEGNIVEVDQKGSVGSMGSMRRLGMRLGLTDVSARSNQRSIHVALSSGSSSSAYPLAAPGRTR